MNRMKTFSVPHKGLRNALAQVSFLAGKTDYSSPSATEQLYELCTTVFLLLRIHAHDEDTVTLAELEQRLPGSTEHDREDHIRIHAAQHRLEEQIAAIRLDVAAGKDRSAEGGDFYLSWSEFQGQYLEHIAEEERITQYLLWEHFTDEELAAHRTRIMQQHPPETLLTWFRFVLPAQNHTERAGLFSGFKKMAPAPFFDQGMAVVKEVLPPGEFAALQAALADPVL